MAQEAQNTPSDADLDAKLAEDEEGRNTPEVEEDEEQEEKDEVEDKKEEVEEKEEEESETEKRLARLGFEARQARHQAKQLREEIARLKGDAPPAPQNEELEREVQARATQQVAYKTYIDQTKMVFNAGVNEYKDFEKVLANFPESGVPLTDTLIEATIEFGDAHKIIHYLGKNIDEAERIQALPAHKMGAAIAKLMPTINRVKQQSKAPDPITPIKGKSGGNSSDNMSIEEYMRKEDKRSSERRRR